MGQQTMLQCFEWYLPANQCLWRRLSKQAPMLRKLGITSVWLPPAYKGAAGNQDVGYGVYDTYDLGEFDQKGSVATKYGTRDEYLQAVKALQQAGLSVLADIVLNHRMGADETETVRAVQDAGNNRYQTIGSEETITAWTKFTFPGRKGKYSDFVWDWTCFDGTDWDQRKKKNAIFLFEGKNWDSGVDTENVNYDYLMGADLDLSNPIVVEELKNWGQWYLRTVGMDGFRLDAVKHINRDFYTDWLTTLRRESGQDLFAVGEYWSQDVTKLTDYIQGGGGCMSLFDVPLHFRLHQASRSGGQYPMDQLLTGTLAERDEEHAVLFVDNHDTQPGQALSSWVDGWFKSMAYALILLRGVGVPCVFWGDLFGIPHDEIAPVPELPLLLHIREYIAYGERYDYFDDANVVGFTREGDTQRPESGLAVIFSDGAGGSKRMYVGKRMSGRYFVDSTRKTQGCVRIDEEGYGLFQVNGGAVAVWVTREAANQLFVEGL